MKILFVCTGNSCRSPLAEAYCRKRLQDLKKEDIEVSSAGILPIDGRPATEQARKVAEEAGADLSGHLTKKVTEKDIREADMIFTMENVHRQYIIGIYPKAAGKTYVLKGFKKIGDTEVSDGSDIADPIGKGVEFYKEVFCVIKEAVDRMLRGIT